MKKIFNAAFVGGLTFLPFGALYLAVVRPGFLLGLGGIVAITIAIMAYREFITFDTVILTGHEGEDNG